MEQGLKLILDNSNINNLKIQELDSFFKSYVNDLFLWNYSGIKRVDKEKFIEKISDYYKNKIISKEIISNSLRDFLEEIKEDYPISYKKIKCTFSKELESL